MTPRAVSVGEVQHLSASQITTWALCRRKWWLEKVAGLKGEKPTPPLELGLSIHGQMEDWYGDGTLPEHPAAALLVKSGRIPARGSPNLMIEYPPNRDLGISVAGIPIHGRIDLLETSLERVDIWDWKSKSTLAYCMDGEELARDVQMMLYGKFAMERLMAMTVRYHHANIRTEEGNPGFRIVDTDDLSFGDVEEYVDAVIEPRVHLIKYTATAEKFEDVQPNFRACYKYNRPCAFVDKCGDSQNTSVHLSALFGEGGGMGHHYLEGTEEPRTGLKETLRTSASTSATKPPVTVGWLALYINAMPVKGIGEVTYLDDIIGQAGTEICKAKGVLDLRMLAYGEGKALLAAGLRKNPPTGVVVATSGELSDVAIETLLPLANVVVRGTR